MPIKLVLTDSTGKPSTLTRNEYEGLRTTGYLLEHFPEAPSEWPFQEEGIDIFNGLPNSVEVEATGGGLAFNWSRKGVGFGVLTLIANDDGTLYVDDECMDADFCVEVIAQAIRESFKRRKAESNGDSSPNEV